MIKCFDGEIDIPLDTFELSGRRCYSADDNHGEAKRAKFVRCIEVSPRTRKRRRYLRCPPKMIDRHGKQHQRSIVLTKLLASMLKEHGQIRGPSS